MTTDPTAIYRALSNSDRIDILDYLAGRPPASRAASVSQVADAVGRSQTWTSKCLRELARVGLVDRRQEDQTVWNKLSDRAVWPPVFWKVAK